MQPPDPFSSQDLPARFTIIATRTEIMEQGNSHWISIYCMTIPGIEDCAEEKKEYQIL